MIVFALLLLTLGGLGIVFGVFTSDIDGENATYMGFEVAPEGLFLIGVAAGAAVLWGLWILKFGTKRSLQIRKERRHLSELSEKLERVDDDRRQETDER